jgi:hypothetical protein
MKYIRRRFVVLLLLALVVCSHGFSADQDSDNPMTTFPRAVGGAFGPLIGTGLSYQQWFSRGGMQAGVGALYTPQEDWGDLLWYLATVGVMRTLYRETFSPWFAGALYGFLAASHEGRIPWEYPEESYTEPAVSYEPVAGSYHPYVAVGGGVGIETVLFRHFSIPVEFGMSVQWEIPYPVPSRVGFVGGVALRYRY